MTDNEIIKALNEKIQLISKCYQEHLDNGGLKDLTAEKDIETLFQIKDFINSLQVKNERAITALLKKEDTMQLLHEEHQKTFDKLQEIQAENERLKEYNENLLTANTALSNEILEIKSEARKEFAERLKVSTYYKSIDDLLEEMEREEK